MAAQQAKAHPVLARGDIFRILEPGGNQRGPWEVGRNCRIVGSIFILSQCEELQGEKGTTVKRKGYLGT